MDMPMTDDVSLEALWNRYIVESNWREDEQGSPYIEIGERVVLIYPWDADGWTWVIYRGSPLGPDATDHLFGDGAYYNTSDARFDAFEALAALVGPIDPSAAQTRDSRRATFRIDRAVRLCMVAMSGISFAEMKHVMTIATDETQWF
jgi:hypothetical protein